MSKFWAALPALIVLCGFDLYFLSAPCLAEPGLGTIQGWFEELRDENGPRRYEDDPCRPYQAAHYRQLFEQGNVLAGICLEFYERGGGRSRTAARKDEGWGKVNGENKAVALVGQLAASNPRARAWLERIISDWPSYPDGDTKRRALNWHIAMAECGDVRAHLKLYEYYKYSLSRPGNSEWEAEAYYWLKRAAVDLNDPEAQFIVAERYLKHGGLGDKDKELIDNNSVKWLEKAAGQGYLKAQKRLANTYDLYARNNGDQARAAFWYKEAAAQGDLPSFVKISLQYPAGRLATTAGYRELIERYKREAEAGAAESAFLLGLAHTGYLGAVPADPEESRKWLTSTAEAGDARAMLFLGLSHCGYEKYFPGFSLDMDLAVDWLEKAAEKDPSWFRIRTLFSEHLPFLEEVYAGLR